MGIRACRQECSGEWIVESEELKVVEQQGIVVREIACRTVLNRSALGGYSLNCYVGCAHACAYCYARFMQRFHPHQEPWGAFIDVKLNAIEVLKRQLRRAVPGSVFVSSACDGWQPIESQYGLTRRCCELLLEHGFSIRGLTKSALILRDLDLFAGHDARVGVTITTPDERLARIWEPGAASVERRWAILDEARRRGIETSVMFGPLLPLLSDTAEVIESAVARCGLAWRGCGLDRRHESSAARVAGGGGTTAAAFPRSARVISADILRSVHSGSIFG